MQALAPYGLRYLLGGKLVESNDCSALVTLLRKPGQGAFSDSDVACVRRSTAPIWPRPKVVSLVSVSQGPQGPKSVNRTIVQSRDRNRGKRASYRGRDRHRDRTRGWPANPDRPMRDSVMGDGAGVIAGV